MKPRRIIAEESTKINIHSHSQMKIHYLDSISINMCRFVNRKSRSKKNMFVREEMKNIFFKSRYQIYDLHCRNISQTETAASVVTWTYLHDRWFFSLYQTSNLFTDVKNVFGNLDLNSFQMRMLSYFQYFLLETSFTNSDGISPRFF